MLSNVFNKMHSKWLQKPTFAEEFGTSKKTSCYLKSGRREYPAPPKVMHKKKAYMARNCGISSSFRLQRQRQSCKTQIHTLISQSRLLASFFDFSAFFSLCSLKQKHNTLLTFYMLWPHDVVMNMTLCCCQLLKFGVNGLIS